MAERAGIDYDYPSEYCEQCGEEICPDCEGCECPGQPCDC